MQMEGRKRFATEEAVKQTVAMPMFCVALINLTMKPTRALVNIVVHGEEKCTKLIVKNVSQTFIGVWQEQHWIVCQIVCRDLCVSITEQWYGFCG